MKKIFLMIINCVLPIILLAVSWSNEVKRWGDLLGGVVVITYIVFFAVYGTAYRHGRSRILYESVIFMGMIFYLVVLYKRIEWVGVGSATDYSEVNFGTKFFLSFICFLVILMRIVTMIVGNNEYRAGSRDRQIRRVESNVEDARINLKTATDRGSWYDVEKAKVELEEAKEKRDKFYDMENRNQAKAVDNGAHRRNKKSWEE